MAVATEGGAGGAAIGFQTELPPDALEEMRRFYGFDKPVHIRYLLWLRNVLRLDLGTSYVYQDPVWDVIKSRFPVSIFLGSDRLSPQLSGLRSARRPESGPSPTRIRFLEQLHRLSRIFGARLGARHGAAGAVRRRQLLECLSARRLSARQLGVPDPRREDHRAGPTTCSCRSSATWWVRSPR